MPSLKMPNPFRRGVDRPSLKQRAASLKASAARLMGRKPAEAGADQDRRMMVAGSMAAVVAAPLPVLAGAVMPASEAGSHPDQALFDAEAAYLAMQKAERAAKIVHAETHAAYSAALGDLPSNLRVPGWVLSATAHPGMPLWKYQIQRRMVEVPSGEVAYRWTANGLKKAIAVLPEAFGRAGRTPHKICELRALIPVAEAYEAREVVLQKQFGTDAALAVWKEAQDASRLAEKAVLDAIAVTPAGLAVKVRLVGRCTWYDMGGAWGALLHSAAAVSAVTLPEPEYDAASWVRAWEGIGGGLMKGPTGSPLDVVGPRSRSEAVQDEARRLLNELSANRYAITRYVRARA